VAPRVRTLHLIDASAEALAVAKNNLTGCTNCEFHHCSLDHLPFADQRMDFGYSLGVLHHVPDTGAALAACVRKLKPGAPFLVYVYYAFDNRPGWFRALWRTSDACRRLIARMPYALRSVVCNVIAAAVYWPLARIAQLAKVAGRDIRNWPLSFYADRSFYVMRTDALDRFGTRLEQRFSRPQLEAMMRNAGLEKLRFSPTPPFWCAVGYRAQDVAESRVTA
jgi:SAM-dependent methyltransferase